MLEKKVRRTTAVAVGDGMLRLNQDNGDSGQGTEYVYHI